MNKHKKRAEKLNKYLAEAEEVIEDQLDAMFKLRISSESSEKRLNEYRKKYTELKRKYDELSSATVHDAPLPLLQREDFDLVKESDCYVSVNFKNEVLVKNGDKIRIKIPVTIK